MVCFIKKEYFLFILLSATLFLLESCNTAHTAQSSVEGKSPSKVEQAKPFHFPYQLESPDQTFEMPKSLVEISGLTLQNNKQKLCAIQDENGLLFKIDKHTGKVSEGIKFYKDGDYEGIECVGKKIYIIKSKGTIYELEKTPADTFSVTKYKSFLNKEHDVEGLGYDEKNNRLLLACKGKGKKAKKEQDHDKEHHHDPFEKEIFAFDLHTKTVAHEPAFKINRKAIQVFLDANPLTEQQQEKLREYLLDPEETKLKLYTSAIAIHPTSGNLYLVASKGKIFMVLSPDGNILHLEKLKKEIHRQPEGLVIDDDGTMYIANEGKDGVGKIHLFRPSL